MHSDLKGPRWLPMIHIHLNVSVVRGIGMWTQKSKRRDWVSKNMKVSQIINSKAKGERGLFVGLNPR